MTGILARLDRGLVRGTEVSCHWIRRSARRDGTATGVVMSLPRGYAPTTYFHVPNDDEARACAEAGMPVVSPDGGTATFGNDDAIDSVDDAFAFAVSTLGCRADRVFLIGMSMGALDVLNWARIHLGEVAGIALVTPALDLAAVRLINGTYTAEVDAAYGGEAAVTAALPTHSPVVYAEELLDVPIQVWYSTDDPVIPTATVEAFIEDVAGDLTSLGAVGHNPSAAAGSAIAEWFALLPDSP